MSVGQGGFYRKLHMGKTVTNPIDITISKPVWRYSVLDGGLGLRLSYEPTGERAFPLGQVSPGFGRSMISNQEFFLKRNHARRDCLLKLIK